MIPWYYFALVSSVLMGIATIHQKKVLEKQYASASSSNFTIIAAVLSLALIPFAKFNMTIWGLFGIFILGIFNTVGYLLTARTYRHGEISVTTATYSSLPILMTVLLALVILGERLTIVQYGSIVIMLVVIYFLLFTKSKSSVPVFDKKKYAYIVILSSLSNAGGAILLKYLVTGINPIAVLILVQIFSAINFMVYMQLKYGGIREIFQNLKENKFAITSQAFLTTAYRATYYIAAGLAAISLVAPLRNTIYVVMTMFSAGAIFHEPNVKRKIAFAFVLLAASYLLIV